MAEAIQEKREWIGRIITVPNKMADKSESKKTAVSRFFVFWLSVGCMLYFYLPQAALIRPGFSRLQQEKSTESIWTIGQYTYAKVCNNRK